MNHISIPKIHIRKIVPNSHCEYLGEFDCADILHFFRFYSGLWFKEHTDENGIIIDNQISDYVEVFDEFNVLEEDYFIIGYPASHIYEGITTNCSSIMVVSPDEYGFETIKTKQGIKIPYKHVIKSKI
jgi:hypothetical protein